MRRTISSEFARFGNIFAFKIRKQHDNEFIPLWQHKYFSKIFPIKIIKHLTNQFICGKINKPCKRGANLISYFIRRSTQEAEEAPLLRV